MAYSYQDYGGYFPRYGGQPQPQPMPMPQPMPQPMAQPMPPQNNGIIWIQGIEGAKSYLVAPNNTVQLWDSESRKIYLKSADASGMPSMKVLNYTIEGEEREKTPSQHPNDYATHEELTALENRILEKIKEVTEV